MDISGYDEMDLRELRASGNVDVSGHINLTGSIYGSEVTLDVSTNAQIKFGSGGPKLIIEKPSTNNIRLRNTLGTIGIGDSDQIQLSSSGDVLLKGLVYPENDGSSGDVITTDGSGTLTFSTPVSSSSTITDNAVVRGDGGSKGVQTSLMSIADNGDVTMNGNGGNEFILRMDTTNLDRGDWRIRINDTNVPGLFFIEDYSGGSWNTDLCIDQDNRIGIGTTNPVSEMTIDGDFTISGNSFLGFNTYYEGDWKAWKSGYASAIKHHSSDNKITIQQSTTTLNAGDAITWNETLNLVGGTVGINTGSPYGTFESYGGNDHTATFTSTGNNAYIRFRTGTTDRSYIGWNNGQFEISNSTAGYIAIWQNLGVGITPDSNYRLYVGGAARTTGGLYTDGSVVAGGTDAQTYRIYCYGTAYATGGWQDSSDDRIKDNEVYITDATSTIMKLKPQTYDKKFKLDSQFQAELDEWNNKKQELQAKIDEIEIVPEADRTEEQIMNLSHYKQELEQLNEPKNDVVVESGLIAQEVYYDAPELRHLVKPSDTATNIETPPPNYPSNDPAIDPDFSNWGDSPAGMNYTGLIPYLIKMNQEQQAVIEDLKATLQDQSAVINSLQNTNIQQNSAIIDLTLRLEALESP